MPVVQAGGASSQGSGAVASARALAPGDLPPGMLVGEYEVEQKIGQGGMGAVYAAVHPVLGRRAAIKIMSDDISRDADSVARFRREARAVAQLASPHIVDVFSFGELPDGRSYYMMPLLAGESLRDRLDRGRMLLDEALDVLAQVCRGLETVHDAGVVHRDLKPENIFLVREGERVVVKLLDFGLVKLAAQDGVAQTQADVAFGTPLYAPPEQLRSARDVDARADIYSLGAVAYEVILGRPPFALDSVAELIAAHLTTEPDAPRLLWPEVPAALDALLLAMLAKEPSKRPSVGHVQDVIEQLRRNAIDTRTRVIAAVATTTPQPSTSRSWRTVAIGAGAAVLAVTVLVLAMTRSSARVSASAAPSDAGSDVAVTVTPIASDAAVAAANARIVATPIAPSAAMDAGAPEADSPSSAPALASHVAAPTTAPADAGVRAAVDAAPAATALPVVPVSVPVVRSTPKPAITTPARVDRNVTFNPFNKKQPR